MPLFPLRSVLFPSMVLPLHIFEPRYRALIERVMDGDGLFGVVLIERGSEVGGDDHRSDFGTMTKVIEAEQLSDGRWAVITVGVERFKVTNWLPDDPYPVAETTPWPDESATDDLSEPYEQLVGKFRRCMALAAESGVNVGPLPETFENVELGSMQMSALAPLAAHDKQQLLGASGSATRIAMLDTMLTDALELIEFRLTEN